MLGRWRYTTRVLTTCLSLYQPKSTPFALLEFLQRGVWLTGRFRQHPCSEVVYQFALGRNRDKLCGGDTLAAI